jgi:hypothetical protein
MGQCIDQETIEAYLLAYNRKSFRAAASSPCGHRIVYKALPDAENLLAGILPTEWCKNDNLFREFMMSFMIPQHIRDRSQYQNNLIRRRHSKRHKKVERINSYITLWKASQTLKAVIQDPILLQCLIQFMHVAIKSGIVSISRWSDEDALNPIQTKLMAAVLATIQDYWLVQYDHHERYPT